MNNSFYLYILQLNLNNKSLKLKTNKTINKNQYKSI